MTTVRAECFGKLPLHGDFIRHQAGQELQAFDRWVQAGLLALRGRPDWATVWPATPARRFVWRGSGRLLAGVLVPSRDAAGRDYPFVVACALDGREVKRQPELAPLLCAPFLAAAEALALRRWGDGATYRDVQTAVDGLALTLDARDAERRLSSSLVETTLERLVVDGGGAWDDRRFLLLANAASLLGPRSRPRFALALPGDDDARVAVWLALIGAMRGGADGFPGLATWSAAPAPASDGLRFVFGEPAGEHFLPLVLAHLPSDACDLAREGLDSPGVMQKARERFGPLASDPRLRAGELAAKLAAAAR